MLNCHENVIIEKSQRFSELASFSLCRTISFFLSFVLCEIVQCFTEGRNESSWSGAESDGGTSVFVSSVKPIQNKLHEAVSLSETPSAQDQHQNQNRSQVFKAIQR